MTDIATQVNNMQSSKLYTLVDITSLEAIKFLRRGGLWQITAWQKLLKADGKATTRLDLMTTEQLQYLFWNETKTTPPEDVTALREQCEALAQQEPVDETPIEELQAQLVTEGLAGAGETIKELTYEAAEEQKTMSTQETKIQKPKKEKVEKAPAAPKAPSTKTLIRNAFAVEGAKHTTAELVALTGKNESSVVTAVSDLRNEKYCKPGEPINLIKNEQGQIFVGAPGEKSYVAPKPVKEPKAPKTDAPADAIQAPAGDSAAVN